MFLTEALQLNLAWWLSWLGEQCRLGMARSFGKKSRLEPEIFLSNFLTYAYGPVRANSLGPRLLTTSQGSVRLAVPLDAVPHISLS